MSSRSPYKHQPPTSNQSSSNEPRNELQTNNNSDQRGDHRIASAATSTAKTIEKEQVAVAASTEDSGNPPRSLVEAFCKPRSASISSGGKLTDDSTLKPQRHTSTLFIGQSKSTPPTSKIIQEVKVTTDAAKRREIKLPSAHRLQDCNESTAKLEAASSSENVAGIGARRRRAANRHKQRQKQQQKIHHVESSLGEKTTISISAASTNLTNGSSGTFLLNLNKVQLASPGKCGFVGRKTALKGENRMSSSTSNDESSCSDDGACQDAAASSAKNLLREKKRSASDKDEADKCGGNRGQRRTRRHQQRVAKKSNYNQQSQQQMQLSSCQSRHAKSSPSSDNVRPQRHRRAIEIKAVLGAKDDDNYYRQEGTTAATSAKNQPWAKNLYIINAQSAAEDEKYSTLPADFSPAGHRASLGVADRTEDSNRKSRNAAGTTSKNPPKTRPKLKNETDMFRKNTAVANIIKHLPGQQATFQTSNRNATDASSEKQLVSSGRKAIFERTSTHPPPPCKSNQIENLRNFFNKPNELEPKALENVQQRLASKETIDPNKSESAPKPKLVKTKALAFEEGDDLSQKEPPESVAFARPLVKAKKIGEHYWPRDEDTEKLLSENKTADKNISSRQETAPQKREETTDLVDHNSTEKHMFGQDDKKEKSFNDAEKRQSANEQPAATAESCMSSLAAEMPSQGSSTETLTSDLKTDPALRNAVSGGGANSEQLNCELLVSEVNEKGSEGEKLTIRPTETVQGEAISDKSRDVVNDTKSEEASKSSFKAINEQLSTKASSQENLSSDKTAAATSVCVSSQRKNSVVSLSTALPTRKTSLPQVAPVDIDEGVYEIEDVINDLNQKIKSENSAMFTEGSYFGGDKSRETFLNDELIPGKLQCSSGRFKHVEENSENASFNSDNLNSSPYSSTMNSDKWLELAVDENQGDDYVSDLSINTGSNSYTDELSREEVCKIPNCRRADLKISGGKPIKKKSYSDPNATAVRTAGLIEKEGSEALQRPSSCSEPILKEQADKLSELDNYKNYQSSKCPVNRKAGYLFDLDHMSSVSDQKNSVINDNQSDLVFNYTAQKEEQKAGGTCADSISQFPTEMLQKEEEQFKQMYDMLTSNSINTVQDSSGQSIMHARSCSAPVQRQNFAAAREIAEKGRRFGIIQAPSLDELQKEDVKIVHKKSLSTSADQLHSSASPRNKKDATEDFGFEEFDKLDLRRHVVKNLLDTENSYVNSLRTLYQSYLKPLKRPENHVLCEPKLVDEIFFQIPEILQHHEKFFENVSSCFEEWDTNTVKMGDLFKESFNKEVLLETYTSYIKNYMNAREAITVAVQAKTAFKAFLENCQRENKEKQGLSDLLIKPVQRIPRYELIIKDLLKHTPENHPDHEGLIRAQTELHALSVQMNKGEKEAVAAEAQARQLQDIESLVEGCLGISGIAKRKFVRQDLCTELKSTNKKDRSLWLFNDTLMCTTSKKGRAATMRRSSLNLWAPSEMLNFDPTGKYKFLWKFPLEDVELLKGSVLLSKQSNEKQIQLIRADQELLSELERTAEKLHINHQAIDEAVKDVQNLCQQRLNEKRVAMQELLQPGRLEIGISTADGMKSFQFEFSSEENKAAFENAFRNFKETLTQQKNRFDPAFMKAIPISKTRNGMQFSCATANTDTSPSSHEVWVCNTDGYVGQICFLALDPEPSQTQCITVCNAKICCITQVPTWDSKLVSTQVLLKEFSKMPLGRELRDRHNSSNNRAHQIISWDDTDDTDEENTSPMSTISSRSPYSTNNSISNCDAAFSTSSTTIGTDCSHNMMESPHMLTSLLGGGAFKKESNGSTLHGSLEDLLGDSSLADCSKILANQGSMWLGTEDGKIKVYSTQESVRGNKHCVELQNTASVQCILYHAGQVFIALSNGDLLIYHRDATNGQWDFDRKRTIQLGTSPYPITKMLVINEVELWCGCQNQIRILDVRSHNIKTFFSVSQDSKRCIQCMAAFEHGVWIAMDKKPQIKLYHSVTHNLLADLDVSNAVNKMLASSDAIIRQHKAACLRITALLVCKDLLWVGTSGGVVLTLVLPNVTPNTTSLPLPIIPQGLSYGHTGHVRFLTAVQLPDKDVQRNSSKRSPSKRKHSSTSTPLSPHIRTSGTTLVISGGDGYEDFGISSSTEAAGREDSTNHLLMWKV